MKLIRLGCLEAVRGRDWTKALSRKAAAREEEVLDGRDERRVRSCFVCELKWILVGEGSYFVYDLA